MDRKVVGGLDRAVLVAREEIAARAFAVTRQYLAVHEVVTEAGGTFAVARVDETTEPGSYHVYFPLRDEPYHCVVAVRPDQGGELQPSWVYMQAAVRVYLGGPERAALARPHGAHAMVRRVPLGAD